MRIKTNCPRCQSEDTRLLPDDKCICDHCGFTWTTPPQKPGGSQYVEAPPGYTGIAKFMDWHGYYVKVGAGYGPYFFNEIERIRKNIEACIIVITGPGGSGKTYFALRLAQILDHDFDPQLQVPFGSEAFLKLISEGSPIRMGQVIIPDESQFTMGARNWYDDIQKDLMNQLEAIRSKGLIIMIIALNMAVLDVIARSYVMTHLIYMNRRGEGTAYKFYMPAFAKEPYKKKLGKVRLLLPGVEECGHHSCLRCRYSGLRKTTWARREKWGTVRQPICTNLRAKYEREKKSYLERVATEAVDRRNEKKAKKEFPEEKVLAHLRTTLATLPRSQQGKYRAIGVKQEVEKVFPDIPLSFNKADSLAKTLDLENT